jgi:mono/diheme cytochrome c family protein
MPKRIFILFIAGVLTPAIFGNAQQHNFLQVKQVPVQPTSPTSGKQMFTQYCAACHGVDGKGNGPAATALKQKPVDLTLLSKDNGGKYPEDHVVSVLRFGSEMPAHGSKDMPIWGPVLRSLNHGSEIEEQQRISNITRYLKTIQVQ